MRKANNFYEYISLTWTSEGINVISCVIYENGMILVNLNVWRVYLRTFQTVFNKTLSTICLVVYENHNLTLGKKNAIKRDISFNFTFSYYAHKYTQKYIYLYIYINMRGCVHVYVCVSVYVCVFLCVFLCLCLYVFVDVRIVLY